MQKGQSSGLRDRLVDVCTSNTAIINAINSAV